MASTLPPPPPPPITTTSYKPSKAHRPLLTTCKYHHCTPAPPFLLLFLLLLLTIFLLLINHLLFAGPSFYPSSSTAVSSARHVHAAEYPPSSFLHSGLSSLAGRPPFKSLYQGTNRLSQIHALLRYLHQHYFRFLLSPCSIFILANLIIFTLLFKAFYLSPTSGTPAPSDLSGFHASGKFADGLPEYAVPSHDGDSFLSLPPHPHYIFSPDPVEQFHVLSLQGPSENSTYSFKNTDSYNRRKEEGEQAVKGVSMRPMVDAASAIQREVKRLGSKGTVNVVEKLQSSEAAPHSPTAYCKLTTSSNIEQEKAALVENACPVATKGPDQSKGGKSANVGKITSSKISAAGCQVVINMQMEPHLMQKPSAAPRRAPAAANSGPAPPLLQSTIKVALPAVPTSNTPSAATIHMLQRPPSSPKGPRKSSLQGTSGVNIPLTATSAAGGRTNAGGVAKPLMSDSSSNGKPAAGAKPQQRKPDQTNPPVIQQSHMVRSHSDQRLSQQVILRSPEHIQLMNPNSSSSIQRSKYSSSRSHSRTAASDSAASHQFNSSSTYISSAANRPLYMQRSQSLRRSGTPKTDHQGQHNENAIAAAPSAYHDQVKRSPSFSEALDALSDAEANKRFSSFIAHRFALMKKELS